MEQTVRYRCPGEDHEIDRAHHLSRLAAFYPACRHCEHRHDTGELTTHQIKQLAETDKRRQAKSLWGSEGMRGVVGNELTPHDARRFAAALGLRVREEHDDHASEPTVVLAGDGRAMTAELVAAASEGLRLSGCRVIDSGAATSGLIAWSIEQFHADGGLLVGNEASEPHTASLKAWGKNARPWSIGGELDAIARLADEKIARPNRRFGALERASSEGSYLDRMREFYHALRPLHFILDTSSATLVRHLDQLLTTSACRWTRLSAPEGMLRLKAGARQDHIERRVRRLLEQVQQSSPHFGIWMDGDGETCRVVDERGRSVACEHLLQMVTQPLDTVRSAISMVLENGAVNHAGRTLAASGARVVRSESTRQAMHDSLLATSARVGGGPSGRLWFHDGVPRADALLTLSLLLTVLSQTDRPLSAILDDAAISG